MGNALKPNAGISGARPDLFGPQLTEFMKRASRGLARLNVYGEEMPRQENRVELSNRKDEFGFPIARIIHEYDRDAVDLWRDSTEKAVEIARSAGAAEVWPGGGAVPGTIHMNGGTIMGADAATSVTNSYGQTHEVANLFLGGSGLFPTEGALHPTNTIMAVTLRGAEHMTSQWSSIAG
jgi:choline dehydrogenase-like flavoprotein